MLNNILNVVMKLMGNIKKFEHLILGGQLRVTEPKKNTLNYA